MQRLFGLMIFGIFLLALTSGCPQRETIETVHFSGQTMGTTWSVAFLSTANSPYSVTLKQQLQERLDQINHLMSTYDPESEISRFNDLTNDAWFSISDETAEVIELSLEISRLTGGAFDITVGPLVELWGFGVSARRDQIPTDQQISESLARVGYEKILLRREPAAIRKMVPELRIDLSAIAKGYAVDVLAEILQQEGFHNYLVEIGGELQVSGHRTDGTPWRIAIEKPIEEMRDVAMIFPLTDTAVATSGNYRNFFLENGQRYAHILDPVTGKPTRHKLASVTILDKSCARADALATALMVLGEKKGRQLCEKYHIAAYFFIHENESITVYESPDFPKFAGKVKQ
jgi:thiamine biosynthesis lipoprotein